MKRIICLLVFVFILNYAHASHVVGGEITWTCQANGQYVFQLKIYRDCSGIPMTCNDATSLDVSGIPGLCSIPLSSVCTQQDISPAGCITCASGNSMGVEELTWVSLPITLNGVPPANGWTFSWNTCCRNNLQNVGGSGGFTVRSKMYAYNGMNANPCFDSSPQFVAKPDYLLCTGYPQTINHQAIDPENDSLVYSFGEPKDQPTSTCPNFTAANLPFNPGYAAIVPFPGAPVIDSLTGIVSLQNNSTTGIFASCIKVTSYKCGQKVSEIYRDYITTFINNCLTAPTPANNTSPDIFPVFTTGFDTTVCAGDTLSFILRANDFEGNPPGGTPQQVTISADSLLFGSGFTNPTQGCTVPPCATLNKVLPSTAVITNFVNFTWGTSLNHAANAATCNSGYYCFTFDVRDNFCPAPATQSIAVCVNVLDCSVGTENLTAQDIKVFYAGGYIHMDLKTHLNDPANVMLTDMAGRQVLHQQVISSKNSMATGKMTPGIYLVSILSGKHKVTKKIAVY